jgi:anthranilate phosphoribosyltransferase
MNSSAEFLKKLQSREVLSRAEAEAALEEILSGRMKTPEIVAFLEAFNSRQVTVAELTGFAAAVRRHAMTIFAPHEQRPALLVDTCGTGGDASGTFNISTAAAIVAAAAGATVAKHGNRSSSTSRSKCGSADVVEALGVHLEYATRYGGRALREVGLAFLFAQTAHAAARYAAPARAQIGRRTVFNLLGPLTNPAGAEIQVAGVFSAEVLDLYAATLAELGVQRAFVVHGADGLDEISLSAETQVAEVHNGSVRRFILTPEDFGVARAPLSALQGGDPCDNAAIIRRILQDEAGPPRDIVVINAAAALVAAGLSEDFRDAALQAAKAISSGAAAAKLDQLSYFSRHFEA